MSRATKGDYIEAIDKTYPLDSRFEDVSQEATEILLEILEEEPGIWRTFPDRFLKIFAEKCEARSVLHEVS